MTTADTTRIDQALAQPSLPAAFLAKARSAPDETALRMFGSGEGLTWGEWDRRAAAVAGGLHTLGVRRGDRIALLLGTRMEFHIADMGALVLGAIPFSIYVTSAVVQMAEICANAEPRVLVTERALLDKARALAATTPSIERVVVVEADAVGPGELSIADLEGLCPADFDAETAAGLAERDDICTLVYTSGTTGPPKGVQFRHGAMMDCLDSIRRRFGATQADRALSYLPMAHIAERIFGHYAAFLYGYEVTSLDDPARLGAALHEVRPTRFFGVPRIFEKLLAGVRRHVSESPDRGALEAAWARRLAVVRAEQAGAPLPAGDDEADRALLAPLAALTGLEQAHFLAVAGAPSALDMLEELTALGLPINEFYGSSETIILTCSPPEDIRLSTAGQPFDIVELKLAEDGEILVNGPTVTPGYFRDEARTAEAFTPDGWFCTGDIGVIDEDGYLKIVDRKKALIINSGGKNMSPANIELAIKAGQPLISQVVAIGDRRPYNVALLVLDRDGVASFARDHGLDEADFATLTQHPDIRAALEAAVAAGNEKLSRIEQIKRFAVLDHDWVPGGDQLTPTQKLKRREVSEGYADVIEELYRA
ncbi:long-chain fatty acid--CoA ligase [Paraconexibacter antarcticus]|uniref:Long-chain fatty acid--CoA ligase n=1 Tax=Paraconexibacter antarcticus TaxID=2949664 RepID=A0ABY5DNA1_9ACTN|nr:long-chain fatty acid--CoA ligase [Paraconexibacter antarcticus]UTI62653.1 long-chain fatty acid--CoA ligase [Paraconexibacter antarcticus]